MTAETVLARLDAVRSVGAAKYLARCPAHDDGSPSLSIKQCDDGRVLMHCFAGCDFQEVLSAAGLTVSDVMPARVSIGHHQKGQKWISARDALSALDHEILVVAIIGADFLQRRELDNATWNRLAIAASRIGESRSRICPARIKP